MGWLNAVPTPDTKKVAGNDERSRLQRLKDDDADVPLPEAGAPWIVTWLLEAGPIVNTPMGAVPLGWQDIEAWSRLTGQAPSPWEARQLHQLSRDYMSALRGGEKIDCPPPWLSESDIQANRDAVARKVGNAFAAFQLARRSR